MAKRTMVEEFRGQTPAPVFENPGVTVVRVQNRSLDEQARGGFPIPFPAHPYRVVEEFKGEPFASHLFVSRAEADAYAASRGTVLPKRVGI